MEDFGLYTDYGSTALTNQSSDAAMAAVMAMLGVWVVVVLIVAIFMLVAMWKLFVKAGKPGWAAIVPFYNTYVLVEIVGRPVWVFAIMAFGGLLGAIPVIGWLISIAVLVFSIIVMNDLSKAFGKTTGFTVGLVLLPVVFLPMLAFGKAKYTKPALKA